MPRPLRVAALSFWHVHAGDYARSAVKHPDTELVAVWDDDAGRGRSAAEHYGVTYHPDLEGLLASEDVDAVTVTTPTAVHRDILIAAAQAGKHIFTEKLLAPTVPECEEIVAACDAGGITLMASLPRLYDGYTSLVSEVIASGRLGDLTYGRVRLSHDGAVADWLPERFYNPGPAVGGALTDLGCHPVYLTQLFLGAEPATVSATYTSVTGRKVEDNAVVTVSYPDGAIGVIEAGFAAATPFSIELGGTQGALSFRGGDDFCTVTGPGFGGGPQQLPLPADEPTPYEQWVRAIRDQTSTRANVTAATELTRLVVAANQAASGQRTVEY